MYGVSLGDAFRFSAGTFVHAYTRTQFGPECGVRNGVESREPGAETVNKSVRRYESAKVRFQMRNTQGVPEWRMRNQEPTLRWMPNADCGIAAQGVQWLGCDWRVG